MEIEEIIKWTYNNIDDGRWNNEEFETREEAIKKGLIIAKAEEWKKLFVGQLRTIQVDTFFDGDDILFKKSECLDKEYGAEFGFGEIWFDSISEDDTKLLERMLCEAFEKWLDDTKKHPKDMYTIENIEQISIE